MIRRAVQSLACVAVLAVACGASASSIWDRVVDPTLADRDYAHTFAAQKEREAELLDQEADRATALPTGGIDEDLRPRAFAVLAREAARAILERFGAANSDDVRLRYDLGRVLARLELWKDARPVLLGALAKAPNDPRASSAWFDVAICDAHLDARDEEAKAYESALAIEDDDAQRALLLGNLAEARMSLGDLEGAADAAERSLQLYGGLALVRWTLAVILDRAGDAYGALEQVKLVVADDPRFARLHQSGVFYEPPYEIHFYEALGWLALARTLTPKTPDWEFDLFGAIKEFDEYARLAAPGDRWRKRAEDHVKEIEAMMGLKAAKPSK